MLRISTLTNEELLALISQPMTDEEAGALIRICESDRWLLTQSLQGIDQGNDSDD
jgi:hypothetical protein